MPRVAVVGSAGYLGRRLYQRLQTEGYEVVGIDLATGPTTDMVLDINQTETLADALMGG